MLGNKFLKFLEEVGCDYCYGTIPNKEGVMDIAISGHIPIGKLKKFLESIYDEGYEQCTDDYDAHTI